MYLLDEWEGLLANSGTPVFEVEYEVKAHATFTGRLMLPCSELRLWEFPGNGAPHVARLLNLQVKTRQTPVMDRLPDPPVREAQYYVPGGMAEEIVVLLTVFSRIHFVVARSVRMDDIPIIGQTSGGGIIGRSQKDGSAIALGDFLPKLELLRNLSRREQRDSNGVPSRRRLEPFMLAARLYHLAIGAKEYDEGLAYVNLVSAVEALLHDFEIEPVALSDFDAPLSALLAASVQDVDQREALANAVMRRERFIGRKFRRFILDHLTTDFWTDPSRPEPEYARFRDSKQLENYLSRIYRARSEALHQGAPFPPTIFGTFHPEVPLGLGMQIGTRQWGEDKLLPSFQAFERIVYHVLNEYLRREAALGAAADNGTETA